MSKCVFFCLHWGEDWVWLHRHKAQIDVVLQWCLSFCRFLLSPHMIMELKYSDIRILVSTLTEALLQSIAQFGQETSSKKNPGCFKLLPLRLTETTCFCDSFDPRACFCSDLHYQLLDLLLFLLTCVPFRIIPFNWICHRLPSLKV